MVLPLNTRINSRTHRRFVAFIAVAILLLPSLAYLPHFNVNAANLNEAYVRLDRMTNNTATGGTVCLRMATTGDTDAEVHVTFPTGFTVNSTASNWTVTTTNLPNGATAMPGVGTATLVASQRVVFPISNITVNNVTYCFNFAATNTLTTRATVGTDLAGTITVTQSDDTPIDTANYALALIANDQVTITATVPPTFTFILGTNSQAIGTLSSSGVVSGSGVTVELRTNAPHGWYTWVLSANAALNSVASGDSISTAGTINGAPSTLSGGTEGYVLDANITTDSGTGGTGTVSIAAEYNGGDTNSGGTLSTTFQTVASADGPTDADIITLIPRVSISALTEAATDYTDTWTVVGAANF